MAQRGIPQNVYYVFLLGKSEIASVYAKKSSISTEEDTMTHYHLPQLYEKLMTIDGTPIELNIFNLPGAHDPRAVECRQNIYPQSVSHNLFLKIKSSPNLNF